MARRKSPQPARQLVLLTGLSGSGKGSVLKAFEDLGFFCIDNLPVGLISQFSELYAENEEAQRAALLVDAREGAQLRRLPAIYRRLRREHPATGLRGHGYFFPSSASRRAMASRTRAASADEGSSFRARSASARAAARSPLCR